MKELKKHMKETLRWAISECNFWMRAAKQDARPELYKQLPIGKLAKMPRTVQEHIVRNDPSLQVIDQKQKRMVKKPWSKMTMKEKNSVVDVGGHIIKAHQVPPKKLVGRASFRPVWASEVKVLPSGKKIFYVDDYCLAVKER